MKVIFEGKYGDTLTVNKNASSDSVQLSATTYSGQQLCLSS